MHFDAIFIMDDFANEVKIVNWLHSKREAVEHHNEHLINCFIASSL